MRGDSIRDRLELEVRVAVETEEDVGVAEEAGVIMGGEEEGDVEAGEGEELSKVEHGGDVALGREGEDDHMRVR